MKHYVGLEIIEELSGWGMVEEFVKRGLGAGILPNFLESSEMKKIKVKAPPCRYSISAIFSKGSTLSRNANAFIDLMRESC